jgi:hypothetical protein
VEDPIAISGGFFRSPERASMIAGLDHRTLYRWTKSKVTSYDHPLNVVEYHGHSLIDERDVFVVAAVQKEFPLARGPIPPDRREQMKRYAAQVHATLTPVR